jgi:hypothetical protein
MDTPKKTLGSDGLKCQRQQGEIKFPGLRISLFRFEERRISIFRILSSTSTDSGLSGREISPSVYRVLILAEADVDFFAKDLKNSGLKWRDGCGGPIAFQGAIFPTLRIWEREWSKVLDQIDVWLSVKLNQTMDSEQITEWMFDVDFERSRLYFTVLQILRIFGECIRTVSADLKALDNLFLTRMMFSFTWLPSDDERLDLSSNWKSITKHQKDAEERLLRRLLDKTEEVKSLRDGVYCYDLLFFLTC